MNHRSITQIFNILICLFQHDKQKWIKPVNRRADPKKHLVPEVSVDIMRQLMIEYEFSLFRRITDCRKIQFRMKKPHKKWCGKPRILAQFRHPADPFVPAHFPVHPKTYRISDRKAHSFQISYRKMIRQKFSCQFQHRHDKPDCCKDSCCHFHPFTSFIYGMDLLSGKILILYIFFLRMHGFLL